MAYTRYQSLKYSTHPYAEALLKRSRRCTPLKPQDDAAAVAPSSKSSLLGSPDLVAGDLAPSIALFLWRRISVGQVAREFHDARQLPFRAFCRTVLARTRLSLSTTLVGLMYFQRLASALSSQPPRQEDISLRLVFLVSMLLANKFSDDDRLSNSAWAKCAGDIFPVEALNAAERLALAGLRYSLSVSEEAYADWLKVVENVSQLLCSPICPSHSISVSDLAGEIECGPPSREYLV
ncbi:hypothetical protein BDK51DRAFT_51950 [Blyttiomyces helicus]|uniref:Cyclin N-terminal domain-containing protein n=1 Tax=Blyttiomyces helicus TaxID=388810 RepID=A0A4P9VTL9_9FUNG|nr:hypothetical protein BDK51DRAFT_51950 [Blyttiomyces helicus]|eukprot:RKO82881.1 hypothetical protein BDK51DRAFT_51950 [Blyttiomyces helicus]